MRPYFCPYRAKGFIPWYPGCCPGLGTGCPFRALAARVRGIAPERGSYSRIGACPYLPPLLINSCCCPCKGRISLAGLAPQHLSRYEPRTGARFINRLQEVGASPYPKYEPPSGALAPLYQSCFFLILNTLPQGFIKSRPYQCKYLPERSAKTKIRNEAPKQKLETNKALQRTKKAPRPTSRGAFFY